MWGGVTGGRVWDTLEMSGGDRRKWSGVEWRVLGTEER